MLAAHRTNARGRHLCAGTNPTAGNGATRRSGLDERLKEGSDVMTVSTDLNRPPNLAFIFQEVITATIRLRSGTEPEKVQAFREQMKTALKSARQEAASRGYSEGTINLAVFAVTAFLDESVL